MSLLSPHRETSLLRDIAVICAAILPALLHPGVVSHAAGNLPGQIPKRPPYVRGFPIAFPPAADYRPREGSVTVADLDRDGRPELVVSLPTGALIVLRADGSPAPGWPRSFDDLPQPAYPLGAPAIGDLDGDGYPEVVTCVVSGAVTRRNFLYAFRADGSVARGWPVEVSTKAGGYYSCSPGGVLLADLDGDGRPEVVRGMNLDEVQALGGDGRALPGWPVRLGPDALGHLRGINADLAAADLDRDGRQEVLFVESGFEPRFVAVSGDGRFMPGFPLILPEVVDRQAPAAADLDDDGVPELVQSTLPFSGTSPGSGSPEPGPPGPPVPAALHVMRADGSSFPGWPRGLTSGGPWGSVLADLL
ncbi:MAG TPA: VCBS repeat-containing protein, partial [Candidatus Polarisedimenticolia bacterium]|nr:VCBS repeat-containing protein [Candidatus Polarisedimenticolia bacterium]